MQAGILVIAIMALLIAALFIKSRIKQNPAENKETVQISSNAALTINNFRHTATRDKKKQWTLKAKSAEVYSERNMVELTEFEMTLFASDRSEVKVTAETGKFDTQKQNINAMGSVTVRYPGYVLKTESLHYQHESHILYTNQKVNITGENVRFSADSAKLELNTDKAVLQGNVNAWLQSGQKP
jgi:LPS export ABC transporter protein LptC